MGLPDRKLTASLDSSEADKKHFLCFASFFFFSILGLTQALRVLCRPSWPQIESHLPPPLPPECGIKGVGYQLQANRTHSVGMNVSLDSARQEPLLAFYLLLSRKEKLLMGQTAEGRPDIL